MENRETRRRTRRRGVVWKTVAGIVVGLAVCNLAVAFREVGRHKDKIWLHRCNSMEKLYEKEHRYPNVEVDLVFREDNTFDVTHDVGVSFGQQLDDYFAHMGETGGRMWLDIKNLNPGNAERMLDALDMLAESLRDGQGKADCGKPGLGIARAVHARGILHFVLRDARPAAQVGA